MATIKFYLFGRFSIDASGSLISKIEPHKAEELLCFLLLNREQPHSREKLADILWGKITENQANSYLRKALWQLQSALNRLGLNKNQFLQIEDNWLQIHPKFKLWLDVSVFDETYKLTQGTLGRNLKEDEVHLINRAVEIYRGELLDGWYHDWCFYERERLQHQYLTMLDKMMDYCEAHQRYEEGLSYGEKILRYDRAREHTHRRLMRMYYLSGNRTVALRQFQKCDEILREELGVGPAKRTLDLLEAIRLDKSDSIQQLLESSIKTNISSSNSLNVIFRLLTILQKDITKIEMQLASDIQIIQKTLGDNS